MTQLNEDEKDDQNKHDGIVQKVYYGCLDVRKKDKCDKVIEVICSIIPQSGENLKMKQQKIEINMESVFK